MEWRCCGQSNKALAAIVDFHTVPCAHLQSSTGTGSWAHQESQHEPRDLSLATSPPESTLAAGATTAAARAFISALADAYDRELRHRR